MTSPGMPSTTAASAVERGVEHGFHRVTGGFEPFDPRGVDQVRIEGEIELDVSGAGRDRVRHEPAFDLDRMRDELPQ